MKTPEQLRDELNAAEFVRQRKPPLLEPTKHFAEAMRMAQESLASVKKSPESDELAEWVSGLYLPIIFKLARVAVSAPDSAGKRSTFPTQKEAYISEALNTVESWYQNPAALQQLQEEVANEQYEQGDERFLMVEMWRDMAKLLMTAASLYPVSHAEPLIQKSEQFWSDLYASLDLTHPDRSFIFVERLLFLHEIGQNIEPDDAINGLNNLRRDLEKKNWHRLATMANKLMLMADQTNNPQLKIFAQKIFEEQLQKHPEGKEMFEESWKKRSFVIGQTIISAFVPSKKITQKKEMVHGRLLKLQNPKEVMADE